MDLELTPLFVHISLFIAKYMFRNGRDVTKCQFLHGDNNDTKAIAIPQVFSENSHAKNAGYQHFQKPLLSCWFKSAIVL